MSDATKKPGGWKAVRQQFAAWDKTALLALVKDLYEADGVNRDLVEARCHPEEFSGATMEKYRGKIEQQFFPARGFSAARNLDTHEEPPTESNFLRGKPLASFLIGILNFRVFLPGLEVKLIVRENF